MDEIGDNLSMGEELTRRARAEEMKRLSGEPYSVYVNGVGWIDAERVTNAASAATGSRDRSPVGKHAIPAAGGGGDCGSAAHW
jgi:hypothetical protein